MEKEDELREFVVKELANHRRISDITQSICERSGMYWTEAEALVREMAVLEEKAIQKRRSPALTALALVTFVGGVALLFVTFWGISNVVNFYRSTQPELLSTINILLLIANEAPSMIFMSALGLAMISGSLLGMRSVWSNLLE